MLRSGFLRSLLAAATIMSVSACLPESPVRPLGMLATRHNMQPAAVPLYLKNDTWWNRMGDPDFSRLIAAALSENISLKIAIKRVEEAQAVAGSIPGPLSMTASGNAQVTDGRNVTSYRQAVGEVGFEWLFDPWGERKNAIKARKADAAAARADAEAAQLLVLLNVGRAYVNLRYRERLLWINQRELRERRNTLSMINQLAEEQQATKLDQVRSQARVAEIMAELPRLRTAIETQRNEIAVLIGRAPGSKLPISDTGSQPTPKLKTNVGVPADLLRNRPDISAAEWRYYSAVAAIDEAEAARYPRLSLSGLVTANILSNTTDTLRYFLGPSIRFPTQPDISGKAEVQRRHAAAERTWLELENTTLGAILEVANAIAEYDSIAEASGQAQRATNLNRQALSLVQETFRGGDAVLSDVIDAETALIQSERTLAALMVDMGTKFIELNVALGAGHGIGPQAALPVIEPQPEKPSGS